MKNITKQNFIHEIRKRKKISPKDIKDILEIFFDLVCEYTQEHRRIEIRDFGVFKVVVRKSKIGRNPKKADVPIIIPKRYALKFTPAPKLKKLIEG